MKEDIMHNADLPNKVAQEPDEEARQPQQVENVMSPIHEHTKPKKNCITFAEGTQSTEVSSSQNFCSLNKDTLSQPAPGLSHRQRLLWLQKRRTTGLWVQCDDCNRWRYLPHILDSYELPKRWYCKMNPDLSAADCSVPEVPITLRDEEDLIHSEYSAGSVVWAKLSGWPWWPAMVDDCPDTEQFYWLDGFSDIPTHYNVVFFDAHEVTRAWISSENLKPYASNRNTFKHVAKDRRYKKRLETSIKQAEDANMLPLASRLNKYSFINRYKGVIGKPKKISKKNIKKFKNQIKKRLNIEISDESDTESDSSSSESVPSSPKKRAMENKNGIIVGTPKRPTRANSKIQETPNEDIIVGRDNVPDSHTVNDGVTESNTTKLLKQPNSMTVQVSSTPALDTMNIDNDSSKTYVPESEISPPYTDISHNDTCYQDLQVRVATPNSDDFEF